MNVLADRIQGVASPDRPKTSLAITMRRRDGATRTVEATDPTGSPAKPLTDAVLAAKFRDCANHAIRPVEAGIVPALLSITGIVIWWRARVRRRAQAVLTPATA